MQNASNTSTGHPQEYAYGLCVWRLWSSDNFTQGFKFETCQYRYRDIPEESGQYHGSKCPGDAWHQNINRYVIDCMAYTRHFLYAKGFNGQNGYFAGDIFKRISFNENVWI